MTESSHLLLENPYRGIGLTGLTVDLDLDPGPVRGLLARCPMAAPTPLVPLSGLADSIGVAEMSAKDERYRMGLGSSKALGNHGLSLAAGASVFGARAVVYISESVPAAFATRLETVGAEVVREGADYEASMAAAATAADANGWLILSDSS